jgi:hypothetical protein
MDASKNRVLGGIEACARRRAAACSRELVRADSGELEFIRAELDYERWLAESCRDARSM